MQCAILLNTVIEWNVTSSSPMEENWESSEEKKTPRCQKHLSRCKYSLILFSLTCRTSCSVVWAISIGFHLSFAFFFGFIFYSFNGIVYFVIFLFHHSFYLLFIFFNIFVALDECTVCGARLTCEKHHVFFFIDSIHLLWLLNRSLNVRARTHLCNKTIFWRDLADDLI